LKGSGRQTQSLRLIHLLIVHWFLPEANMFGVLVSTSKVIFTH
jgi:hypothetical protein